MAKECRFRHFPISFFSMILGLAGFVIALQKIEEIAGLGAISPVVLALAVTIFIALTVIYMVKIFKWPDQVKEEFNHPVKLSFFPTFSISLLLLSIAFLAVDRSVSVCLWVAGAVIHLMLTIKIISIWIQHTKFEIKHMNPAWFIPAVGNILVPVAGVVHMPVEVSWFFFSIGLIFWIVLFVIFFNRIIFHHPLPEKLLPTLFILIAPPAVGFISTVKLTGGVTAFGLVLYYFALFLFLLLFSQFSMFRRIRFFLSWWAYSFPIAAMTISSILMFHQTETIFFKYLSYFMFAILTAIILLLLAKTAAAISRREICVEED